MDVTPLQPYNAALPTENSCELQISSIIIQMKSDLSSRFSLSFMCFLSMFAMFYTGY